MHIALIKNVTVPKKFCSPCDCHQNNLMGKEVFCFSFLNLVEKDFYSKSKLNTINSKKNKMVG